MPPEITDDELADAIRAEMGEPVDEPQDSTITPGGESADTATESESTDGDGGGELGDGEPTDPTGTSTADAADPTNPGDGDAGEAKAGVFLEALAAAGVDTSKWRSDQDAIQSFVHTQSLIGRYDEERAWGAALRRDPLGTIQQVANAIGVPLQAASPQQAQQPQQAAPPPPTPQQRWGAPPYDPSWERQVEMVDGKLVPVAGAEPGVVQKLQAAYEWQADMGRRLLQDPTSVLMPVLGDEVRRIAAEEAARARAEVTAQLEAERTRNSLQQLVASDAEWLFQNGRDPSGGLTMLGQMFTQHINRLSQVAAFADHNSRYEQARYATVAQAKAAGLGQQQAPQQPVQPAKAAAPQRGAKVPARTPTAAVRRGFADDESLESRLSLLDEQDLRF